MKYFFSISTWWRTCYAIKEFYTSAWPWQSNLKSSETRVCAFSFFIWVKVATGQPHEGSTYSARKDCQMALNRAEYARVKLGELRRTCETMLDPQTWRPSHLHYLTSIQSQGNVVKDFWTCEKSHFCNAFYEITLHYHVALKKKKSMSHGFCNIKRVCFFFSKVVYFRVTLFRVMPHFHHISYNVDREWGEHSSMGKNNFQHEKMNT